MSRLLWAIATNFLRFVRAFFLPPERGIVPLELSAACLDREHLTNDETSAVRELRIPDACVAALSGGGWAAWKSVV